MNKIVTCSKLYSDFPFAHRQHTHDGHCALVHGHNWSFEITFGADALDACGFVVDFGKLGFLKRWLADRFDHTLVLNEDDPLRSHLQDTLKDPSDSSGKILANIVTVPNCGAEGLAAWVLEQLNEAFFSRSERGVRVIQVRVFEDSKNSATVALV